MIGIHENPSTVELAEYILKSSYYKKKPLCIEDTGTLECKITCDDNTEVLATGLFAHELKKTMNEFPKKGQKIKTKDVLPTYIYPNFTCMKEDAKRSLQPDTEYTVAKVEIYSSWCAVWLEELPWNDKCGRATRDFNRIYFV